jgi:hypothetical protein
VLQLGHTQFVVAGDWHRIDLVWDGLHRKSCVADVLVAEDILSSWDASGGGLYIGVGQDYAVDTLFSQA